MHLTGFERYLNAPYTYKYEADQHQVRTHEDALVKGINCKSLLHIVVGDLLNIQLPVTYGVYELYADTHYTSEIDSLEEVQPADVLFFGYDKPKETTSSFVPEYNGHDITNWAEFPVNHMGMVAILGSKPDEHQILHASQEDGTTVLWPLHRFGTYSRQAKIHGIRRLKNPLTLVS